MFDQAIIRVRVDDGHAEKLPGAGLVLSLSASRDGSRLAFRSVEGRGVGDVFVLDLASGRAEKRTNVNPELDGLALGDLKPVRWRSFDGMEIWGLLLTPPGWTPGRRLPLLVYCHGGPNGGVTFGLFPQFIHTVGQVDPYGTEAMASAGYAVLFPMPRGGGGYGEKGQRAIVNSWGEGDYKDILAGVDDLISRGIADPERLGVMGASYGGFMTNWMITQTGRFKAASSAASISDLADQYFLSDGGDVMAEYFRRPWDARESYFAHSPINFAKNVTTPLLILHSEDDLRCPMSQAEQLFVALKKQRKDVKFVRFPDENHELSRSGKPRHRLARFEFILDWFADRLSPRVGALRETIVGGPGTP